VGRRKPSSPKRQGFDFDNEYVWLALAHDHPLAEDYYLSDWHEGTMRGAVALLEYLKDGTWAEGTYDFSGAAMALMLDRFILHKTATNDKSRPADLWLKNVGYYLIY